MALPAVAVASKSNPPETGQRPQHYQRSRHYPELDAVRGLAALVVVFGHFLALWEPDALGSNTQFLLQQVLRPLFNGSSSVILFFLLSGFVLSLPYKRGNPLPYPIFLFRRLARIYLPYLAALALALLADWRFHGPMQVSTWFSQTWSEPLTWPLVLQHVLLIGNYDTAQVNTAFWSLAVEMRLSLLFPLLCLPLLLWRRKVALALFSIVLMLQLGSAHLLAHRFTPITITNISEMLSGLLAFSAGILLARRLEWAQAFWSSLKHAKRLGFFVLSLLLLEWSSDLIHTHAGSLTSLLTVVGASGILVTAMGSALASRLLNHKAAAWLGRVSYSLYLVHGTVLFAIVHLLLGRYTRVQLLVPYLVGALGLAALFFHSVERPSIALSRMIGRSGRALTRQPAPQTLSPSI